jgi:hypothetical protein
VDQVCATSERTDNRQVASLLVEIIDCRKHVKGTCLQASLKTPSKHSSRQVEWHTVHHPRPKDDAMPPCGGYEDTRINVQRPT